MLRACKYSIEKQFLCLIALEKCSFPFYRDVNVQIPPCPIENDANTHSGKLVDLCREHAATYHDLLEKYFESTYTLAEDLLKKSQERQIQQLKKLLEKETSDVMRQLQQSRKNEVKQLALVHKDKDELERMKREVDSTLVEKGVAERFRLTETYEKRREKLQKQHDSVKNAFSEQKSKVSFGNQDKMFPFTNYPNNPLFPGQVINRKGEIS